LARLPEERAAPVSRRVLVLDTDPGIRWALEKGLKQTGYIINVVSNLGEALRAVREEEIDAVVLEIQPEAGLTSETLALFIAAPCAPRVLCISVDSEPHVVIDCMKRGAADFLPKPFSLAEVRTALSRILAVENGAAPERRLPSAPRGASSSGSYLIGISPVMQELRETIEQVAKTDLNCLLRGESGTGKDMVAREVHRLSKRHDKPFVKVNCTALPEQLLESELFGYEKGAFTGAVTSKPGRFELAHKGIIFLDEIGDMQPSLQAKLLQVIEHKEFTKLGGRRHITVDVQIVAATNANLEQRTKEGAFRDDLYFRLNEVCLWVPTLATRKEDVPLLVRHFIKKHQHSVDGSNIDITGEDLTALAEHDWPGNVRELESTVKRWLALGKKMLPTARPGVMRAPARPAPVAVPPSSLEFDEPIAPSAADERAESEVLLEALERNQWNRRKAADDLGMSYQTLRRRIEKYGLDQPH
jgi:DNA-binding NtrC family response regulator